MSGAIFLAYYVLFGSVVVHWHNGLNKHVTTVASRKLLDGASVRSYRNKKGVK
jgi:hypothetical protein